MVFGDIAGVIVIEELEMGAFLEVDYSSCDGNKALGAIDWVFEYYLDECGSFNGGGERGDEEALLIDGREGAGMESHWGMVVVVVVVVVMMMMAEGPYCWW